MNPTELAARLNKGEDLHTEFMGHPIHADDLAASIIAFANTDGGQMIFGVNDEQEITGLGDETQLWGLYFNPIIACLHPISPLFSSIFPRS
ncbi:MAG: ATP-binding protein [Euryarchaeota archaeon]|nr:ATP-binding protein [Euryarchaeota archaeon]